jgi:hypothetical protein
VATRWLERAAHLKLSSKPTWIAPKSAKIGDEAVIYVAGIGFFATARIKSEPKPRRGLRRHGAAIVGVKLIKPFISLGAIKKSLPKLSWAGIREASLLRSSQLQIR